MSKKGSPDNKQLRAIGHKLKPIVTVAGNGLNEGVIAEIDRALTDHELIKIKLAVGSREAKAAVAEELCERAGAEIVQELYAPDYDPGGAMFSLRDPDGNLWSFGTYAGE